MHETAFSFLIGSVSGWETSREASSSGPQSLYYNLRPYICSVDGCQSSYRREDHLTCHLLQHPGITFKCSIESCCREFAYLSSVNRHLEEFHHDNAPLEAECQKQFVCPQDGCGKVFGYASRLQKHEDSHDKLESIEEHCTAPGCMKTFANKQCLTAHIESCHKCINCEICGKRYLRKNMKQHLRQNQESKGSQKRVQCTHEGCPKVFSSGDLEIADELFHSKPKGGQTRKCAQLLKCLYGSGLPSQHAISRWMRNAKAFL